MFYMISKKIAVDFFNTIHGKTNDDIKFAVFSSTSCVTPYPNFLWCMVSIGFHFLGLSKQNDFGVELACIGGLEKVCAREIKIGSFCDGCCNHVCFHGMQA